jgi:hypothetical protein
MVPDSGLLFQIGRNSARFQSRRQFLRITVFGVFLTPVFYTVIRALNGSPVHEVADSRAPAIHRQPCHERTG